MLKLVFAIASLVAGPSLAQVPGVSLPMSGTASTPSPYGIPITRVNDLDSAPVVFQGQTLFQIAAPAAPPGAAVPAIVHRVDLITDNLQRIVPPAAGSEPAPASRFDPKTFKVNVGSLNGYPTLYATDDTRHHVAPIMTLTTEDAELNGTSQSDLAAQWQAVLQTALGEALVRSEPQYYAAQLRKLPFVIGAGILATILLLWLRSRLLRREYGFDKARDAADAAETTDPAAAKKLRAQIWIVSGLRQLSGVFLIAVWVAIVIWVLGVRTPTRALAGELTSRSIRLIVLWVSLLALDGISNIAIVRVADNLESGLFIKTGDRARLALRRSTIVRAAENLKSIAIWAIAILATLSILSVSAASVLTIGAVIAFALSFAMQNLIKDYLNGFLILAEDQFAIGDYVTINAFSGTVEDLTLRITRLRADDGNLITIPNSSITAVENQTRLWSRIDLKVAVSASGDVARAIGVLSATLEEIAKDRNWRRSIIDTPQVLGVDAVSHAGIVLRAWIKTTPAQKAALTREINRQVNEAFRKDKIALGIPQSIVLQPSTDGAAERAAEPAPGPKSQE